MTESSTEQADGQTADRVRGDLQRRPVLPILSIRGIYVQRNQAGLMIDAVACIVGEKPKYEVPPIDFV